MIATGYPIVNTPGWYFLRMQQRQGWLMPLEATARFEGIYLDADGRYALRNLHDGALFQLNGGPVGARENRSALETFRRTYAPALGCGEPAGVYGGAECVTAGRPALYRSLQSKNPPICLWRAAMADRG